MIKKAAIVTAGGLLLLVLLFGSNLMPYAQTAWQKARNAVNDSISIEFKIDAAERELANVDQEQRNMLYKIAKEKVAIERLETQVAKQQEDLDKQYAHIMRLRDHLESGDTTFVSHNREFSNTTVRDNLANHFANYKIASRTAEKTRGMLSARRQVLEAAESNLNEMIAKKHTLQLEIEDLRAQLHMLEVSKSVNNIHYDDSHLSNAESMILDARTRLEVEAEVNALMPQYDGSIPMDEDAYQSEDDLLEQIDVYFQQEAEEFVAN